VAQIPAQPVSLALANSVPAAPQEGVGSIHAESVGAVKAQSAVSVNTESASAATAPVAAKGEAAGTAPAPASVAAKAESANTAAPVKKPKGAPTPKAARGPATPIAAMVRASGTSTVLGPDSNSDHLKAKVSELGAGNNAGSKRDLWRKIAKHKVWEYISEAASKQEMHSRLREGWQRLERLEDNTEFIQFLLSEGREDLGGSRPPTRPQGTGQGGGHLGC